MPTYFPDGFLWGVATAAYQIEGAVAEDGRGESIWDRFSHTAGKTAKGETGDVACDHYHRWAEDVDLLADLGCNAYRFSIAWPRIQPDGRGRPNPKGIAFYERLVDRLLAHGITPVATLYHWDLPQALQDRGGWPERDTCLRFVDYAEVCARALGDRIGWWITHNEPKVVAFIGHLEGRHAPGVRDPRAAVRAAHHLLLSHGLAVEAMRGIGVAGRIGITLDHSPCRPASDRDEDIRATELADAWINRWCRDPVAGRGYPAVAAERIASLLRPMDHVQSADMERIAAPIDFLGLNYYFPMPVRDAPTEPLGFEWVRPGPDERTTAMGWPIDPSGLEELLLRLANEHPGLPLLVTESGIALRDEPVPDADGRIDDRERIGYLRDHFEAAARAISAGADIRGYLVWSFMDNFEWAEGYRPRFGVVHVDYETLERIPKASAHWLAEVARANELVE